MNELPNKLISALRELPHFDEKAFRYTHSSKERVTSVRVNPAKPINIYNHFPGAETVPWCTTGFYLDHRPSFTLDPLFHAGAYYVQEASSMFLEQALKQTCDLSKPLRVLDLCAAPGGKSTLVQSLISPESLLISNEVIKTRVTTLSENMTKWGAANVVVTNNDAKDFQRLPGFFDVLIVDAPCSGSGLFRKDNDAVNEWSENNVMLCSQRQQRILADVMPALKESGVLIYSTCSYSKEEDEDIADTLSAAWQMENIRLDVEAFRGICETRSEKNSCFGYRFYPDKIKGEGFFLSVFKKNKSADKTSTQKKIKPAPIAKREADLVSSYIQDAQAFFFLKQDADIIAFPISLSDELYEIKSALYIKKAGIRIGSIAGAAIIPSHELAMSNIMANKFPCVDLELAQALDYLRRKVLNIAAAEKAWTVVKYLNVALGFIKVLQNRINNYYPASLRILNK